MKKVGSLACAFLVIGLVGSAYANLVSYWNLDEEDADSTFVDLAGWNNGIKGSGLTSGVPGKFGNAIEFDGSDINSFTAGTANMSFGSSPYSVSYWVYNPTLEFENHYSYGQGSFGNFNAIFNNGSAGNHFYWDNDLSIPGGTFTANQWQFVVTMWTGTDRTVYVDGVEVARNQSGPNTINGNPFRLGADHRWQYNFTGRIDEVAVWNEALTLQDIDYLWYNGQGTPLSSMFNEDPFNLIAKAVNPRRIDLSWRDNSDDEISFRIERKIGADGTWAYLNDVGPDVSSYSDGGLNSQTPYFYRVYAHTASGDSEYTNVSSATTPQANPHLIAYWDMDESASSTLLADTGSDAFDNNAVVNTALVNTGVEGKFGNAVEQIGLGETNISAPDTGLPMGRNNMSMSMWFYGADIETQQILLSYGLSSVGRMNALDFQNQALRVFHYDSDMELKNPALGLKPNTWHFVVYTMDFFAKVQKIYINGTLLTTQSIPDNIDIAPDSDAPSSVEIGGWERNGGSWPQGAFQGKMDDVAIWDRVLGTVDVLTLWNNGEGIRAGLLPKNELPQTRIYVATDGNDSNDGSINSPLATLHGARDKIRQIKQSGGLPSGGIAVLLREGRYPVTNTLILDGQDSGVLGSPIVYSAFPGEKVILDGSKFIPTGGFALVQDQATLDRLHPVSRGNVYSTYVSDPVLQSAVKIPYAEISLDDQMMQQSRFPNLGFSLVDSVDASGEVKGETGTESNPKGALIGIHHVFSGNWQAELNRIKKARMRGYVSAMWHKETKRLHSVDGSNRIRLMDGTSYGMDNLFPGRPSRPFFDNLLCEIDTPGEWYYDDLENKLYIWPHDNQIDENSVLGVWAGPGIFELNGNFIRVENLTMQCIGNGAYITHNGRNNIVAGCTMRYGASGSVIYNIWSQARNSGLLSCNVYDFEGGGRLYSGGYGNNWVEYGNCFIENCHFTQVYSKDFYGKVAAIKGAGNIFRNNLIHNINGQASTFGGVDQFIGLNEIFNVGIEEGDGGSFYSGASFETWGNRFQHNFWHHIICVPDVYARAAIFSDDGDLGEVVIENVFYKAGEGFKINEGAGHYAKGNVGLDCIRGAYVLNGDPTGLYNTNMGYLDQDTPFAANKNALLPKGLRSFGVDNWVNTVSSTNWNIHIHQFWRDRYPRFDDLMDRFWNEKSFKKHNTFVRQVSYSNDYGGDDGITAPSQSTSTGWVRLSNLDDFENPSNLNFKYTEPRPSWAADIPFHNIGLYQDTYRTRIPDKNIYRKAVKDRWNGVSSNGGSTYNPDTVNQRLYYNSGKLIMIDLMKSPIDIDNNGKIDLEDFALFSACWFDSFCIDSDFDGDGFTGIDDLRILAENWFVGTGSVSDNLVLYLPFDTATQAQDQSGKGNHGQFTGSAAIITTAGNFVLGDGALSVTAATVDDGVWGNSNNGFPYGNEPWSLSTWVKTTDTHHNLVAWGKNQVVHNVGVNTGLYHRRESYTGQQITHWTSTRNLEVTPTTTPPWHPWDDGDWHLITGTYDGTTQTLYVDGQVLTTSVKGDLGLTPDDNGFEWVVGKLTGGQSDNNQVCIGQIDDVAIWNITLTPAQVSALWNGGAGLRADMIP